jgi:hypothetical protein
MPDEPGEPGEPDEPDEPGAGLPSTLHLFAPEQAAMHVPLLPHVTSSELLVSLVMLQPPPAQATVHVAPLPHVTEQLPAAQSKVHVFPAAHVN